MTDERGAGVTRATLLDALPEFLTPAEVGAVLGIGRSLVYELLRTGAIPSVRFGRLLRVPKRALSRPADGR